MFKIQIVRTNGFDHPQVRELSIVLGMALILIGVLVVLFPILLAITAGALLVAGGISLVMDAWTSAPERRRPSSTASSVFQQFRAEADRVYVPREEAARFFANRF